MTSLAGLAHALGGKVRRDRTGPHVVAPGPGCKRRDRSLSVWIEGNDIRVHSHRGLDWREAKDYVRQRCGLPASRPGRAKAKATKRKAKRGAPADLYTRETLRVIHDRRACTPEQFRLLIDDHRNAGGSRHAAELYARQFGFATVVDRYYAVPAVKRTADERAAILGVDYETRQRLRLRVTGATDKTKEQREYLRRQRDYAARRAKRAARKAANADALTAVSLADIERDRACRRNDDLQRSRLRRWTRGCDRVFSSAGDRADRHGVNKEGPSSKGISQRDYPKCPARSAQQKQTPSSVFADREVGELAGDYPGLNVAAIIRVAESGWASCWDGEARRRIIVARLRHMWTARRRKNRPAGHGVWRLSDYEARQREARQSRYQPVRARRGWQEAKANYVPPQGGRWH